MSTLTTVVQNDVVKVLIEGEQIVHYRQVVRMPRAEFEKLDEMFEKGGRIARQAEQEVGDCHLRAYEVHDAEPFQLGEFRLMEDKGGDAD